MTLVQLSLPGVAVTSVGASHLDRIDAAGARILLGQVERATSVVNWVMGDLVLEQIIRARDGDHSLDDVPIPADQSRARRCLRVSLAFPHDQRRPGLSWSHHDAVAQLDHDERGRWLELAEESGWTVAHLVERVKASRSQGEQQPLPGTTPWRTGHRAALDAIDKAFAAGAAAVLVRADGTCTPLTGDPIDVEGSDG